MQKNQFFFVKNQYKQTFLPQLFVLMKVQSTYDKSFKPVSEDQFLAFFGGRHKSIQSNWAPPGPLHMYIVFQ